MKFVSKSQKAYHDVAVTAHKKRQAEHKQQVDEIQAMNAQRRRDHRDAVKGLRDERKKQHDERVKEYLEREADRQTWLAHDANSGLLPELPPPPADPDPVAETHEPVMAPVPVSPAFQHKLKTFTARTVESEEMVETPWGPARAHAGSVVVTDDETGEQHIESAESFGREYEEE